MDSGFWKTIEQAPKYEIYSEPEILGEYDARPIVRNKKTLRIMKSHVDNRGYHRISLSTNERRINIRLHQIFASAFVPNPNNKPFVDHKDGNKRNNRVSNLRWCTYVENNQNAKHPVGKSGITGVRIMPNGKYQVQISINGKTKYLGIFATKRIAELVYLKKAFEVKGEFMHPDLKKRLNELLA